MIVKICFEVLFLHVKVRTLGFFSKVWNRLFILKCSLSQVKANFGKHVFELFHNFNVSEGFVDFYFNIVGFDSLCNLFDPKVRTSFCKIDEFHADRIGQNLINIVVINHGHKFIGTDLD